MNATIVSPRIKGRILVMAIACLALLVSFALIATHASAEPASPPVLRAPIYLGTGGPYTGASAAAEVSARAAKGPIARQEVSFFRYGELMEWLRIRGGGTVDSQREVYLVVNSTPTVNQRPPGLVTGRDTCNWYAQVIDATTGTIYSYGCGEGFWPTTLPVNFQNILR